MKVKQSDIILFIENQLWEMPVGMDSDLFSIYKIDGDDCFNFIDAYGEQFNIDLSQYKWYFHHGEEGVGLGAMLFKTPNKKVKRIAVSPRLLLDFAQKQKWEIAYPEHPPIKRFELLFSDFLFIILGLSALLFFAALDFNYSTIAMVVGFIFTLVGMIGIARFLKEGFILE